MKDLKKFYMELAKLYASRSKDPKHKVGCVIVTREGILYPGYNGDEKNGSNTRDSLKVGGSGFVHAEANALMKFNPTGIPLVSKAPSAFVIASLLTGVTITTALTRGFPVLASYTWP